MNAAVALFTDSPTMCTALQHSVASAVCGTHCTGLRLLTDTTINKFRLDQLVRRCFNKRPGMAIRIENEVQDEYAVHTSVCCAHVSMLRTYQYGVHMPVCCAHISMMCTHQYAAHIPVCCTIPVCYAHISMLRTHKYAAHISVCQAHASMLRTYQYAEHISVCCAHVRMLRIYQYAVHIAIC
jgi:hypothetical protein